MKEKLIFGVYAGAFIYIFILISSIDEAIKFSLKIFIAPVVLALGFIYVLYASKKETKALIIGAILGLEILIFFSKQVSGYFLSLWHDTSLYQKTLLVETFLLLISIVFLSYRFTSYKNGEQNNSNNALGNTSFLDSGITIFTKMAETATFFFTSIFLSFVGFYFILMMFGHFDKKLDKGDSFSSLVQINLAFLSIMSAGIYKWVEKNITKRVDKQLSKEKNLLSQEKITSYVQDRVGQGYVLWFIGSRLPSSDEGWGTSGINKERQIYLNKAIELTRLALIRAKKMRNTHGEAVLHCKNNLAFYLAERGLQGDEKETYEIANELHSLTYEKDVNYPSFMGVWALYLYRFKGLSGERDARMNEAFAIIRALLSDDEIDVRFREFLLDYWRGMLGKKEFSKKISKDL